MRDVAFLWMVCAGCGRFRAMYDIAVYKRWKCPRCGLDALTPHEGVWWWTLWYLGIVGLIWRRGVLAWRKRRSWDPRMPVRLRDPQSS